MDSGRRNFHAVWPSLFATSTGLNAFLPVLAFYVQERFGIVDGAELAFWTSIVYGAAPLAAALAGPLWGGLGDRVGKKPMAIRANLAIAATTALMPFAPTPVVLLVMRAVQGVLAGYVAPAMALVSQGTPRSEHGLVIARLQVAMAAGQATGPLLGAAVTHWFGRDAVFWLTSVLSAGAALRLHLSANEERPQRLVGAPPFLREFLHSSRQLLGNRVFAWLLVLVLVLRLGQNMAEPFLALFVRELGPEALLESLAPTRQLALDLTVGSVFAVLAVAQIGLTPWWGRLADRHGPLRCLAVLGVALAIVQAASAAVGTIDQFLVARALAATLMAGSMALAYAAASKRVVDERRTLAFSMIQSCMQFAFAGGPMLGAMIAVTAGGATEYRRLFVAAAILCMTAGLGMFVLRRHRTEAHNAHGP
ncbi:MAG: MFS transporter [Planctomycetes bacterium]|nr:MFS transporter [Planctomycetota bacterium]